MSSAPQPGQFGRYTVHAVIGEGAMGRVYRAFDPLAQRVVAIKTLKPEYLTSETRDEFLRRFRREAQAAGALSHPGIITVFDVGENFFVMEMVEGTTLQQMLAARGRVELGETLRILAPIADALDYAHSKGTIHRDIKPGNIMVLPDGRPKLMDFGVAHLSSTVMTAAGQFLGSPGYMAPEQIVNGDANARTDLFSLAVVCYELLAGKRPFQGDNITTVIYRVVNETPPSPRHWNGDLPARYDEIFARALAKDPAVRYESAGAFMAALDLKDFESALATAFPSPAAPLPAATAPTATGAAETLDLRDVERLLPAASAPRRRPRLAVAAVLALLAAAGLAVWSRLRPAPVPVATVPPTTGIAGLRIEADPPGATVSLDGTERGPAPVVLDRIAPGAHTVRLVREGFASAELSIDVVAGVPLAPLRFVLQPTSATLQLAAEPAEAAFVLDGRPAGSTPVGGLLLAPGRHELRVERKGYKPWLRTIEPHAGETVTLTASLEPGKAPAKPRPTPLPLKQGDLVELGPDVTPPRRLTNDPIVYPEAAVRLRLQGSVAVEMIVTESGDPTDVRVIESAGEILDHAVVEAAQHWKFEPARKKGVKVRVRWPVRQRFELAR